MVDSTVSEPIRALLVEWKGRAMVAHFSFHRAAARCKSWDTLIGGSVSVLAATAGTTVFATLASNPNTAASIVIGATSVVAALLSALQVFAALPKRVELYEQAARRYGAIRRQIEQLLASQATGIEIDLEQLNSLRANLDATADPSPTAPRRLYQKARRHYKGEYTWWERASRKILGLPQPNALAEYADATAR